MVIRARRAAGEAITVLDELVFETEFGMDWKNGRTRSMDFSNKLYNLESLVGGQFQGVLNPALKKYSFVYVDVSNNNLSEIDCLSEYHGFANVAILKARHNCLISVRLQLSALKELNLAHNELIQLPKLEGVPTLEVVILSHNRINGKFDGLAANCKRLKRIDISSNNFQLNPTHLQNGIRSLGKLGNLVILKIKDNPFCEVFPEYQVYFLKALTQLTVLDDVKISQETRVEVNATRLLSMDRFDEIYDERLKKKTEEEAAAKGRSGVMLDFPCLVALINLFKETIQNPDRAQECMEKAVAHAVCLNEDLDVYGGSSFFSDIAQIPESMETFMQMATMLIERHDSVRKCMIEILARCSLVTNRKFGKRCLETLGMLMSSGDKLEQLCVAAIEKNVIPLIRIDSDMLQYGMATLAKQFPVIAQKSLHKLVVPLGMWFIKEPNNNAVIDMLDACTCYRENALLLIEHEYNMKLYKQILNALSNKSLAQDTSKRGMWLGILRVAKNVVNHETFDDAYFLKVFEENKGRAPTSLSERRVWQDLVDDEVENDRDIALAIADGTFKISMLQKTPSGTDNPETALHFFRKNSLHVKLITRHREMKGEDLAQMSLVDSKTSAEIIWTLTVMMRKNVTILKDCCNSYHLVKELCDIIRQHIADPSMLTAACNSLRLIVYHCGTRMEYIKYIAETLANVSPLLQYLGGKRYQHMYEKIEKYREVAGGTSAEDHGSAENAFLQAKKDAIKAPPLNNLTSELLQGVFISIVELTEFFCVMAYDEKGNIDTTSDMISQCFDRAQRETVLLNLLEVPSDELKISVMKCVSKVQLWQLDLDEIGKMIKVLSDTRTVGVGKTEYILSMIISMMRIIAMTTTETDGKECGQVGQAFRQHQSELAIAEVFDILFRNSLRDTYGDDEEEDEKLQLSSHCLSFLLVASKFSAMRKYFRTKEASSVFLHVLRNEEAYHSPWKQDICIEATWSGRSLEFLLDAISGIKMDKLDVRKKSCFRVLARIAHVLEGKSDVFIRVRDPEAPGVSYETLARREARMWSQNDDEIKGNLQFLDADEWQDRMATSENFIEAGGIDVLLQLLVNEGTLEREKYYKNLENDAELFRQELNDGSTRKEAELLEQLKAQEESETPKGLDFHPEELGYKIDYNQGKPDIGKKMLMTALLNIEETDAHDEESGSMFVHHPEEFSCNEHFFEDDVLVNRSYCVAAVLRSIYMLVLVSPNDRIRLTAITQLRSPPTVRRLLAILDSVPLLPCNCCAKLLRILGRILMAENSASLRAGAGISAQMSTEEALVLAEDSDDNMTQQLILFDVVCVFLKRVGGCLLHLLRSTRSKFLSEHEKNLCTELASTVAVVTSNIPYVRFSSVPSVQEHFVERCVSRIMPPVMIRCAVAMVLYDLQSNGTNANLQNILSNALTMTDATGKKKRVVDTKRGYRELLHRVSHMDEYNVMRRQASWVLTEHLIRNPDNKYAVLEAFINAEVFSKQSVRPSYLNALLSSINLGAYRLFVETNTLGDTERIYAASQVYMLNRSGAMETHLLVLSSLGIYCCALPKGPPAYHTDKLGSEWKPAWELRAPRQPEVIWSKPYYAVSRLWQGPGDQLFFIGWRDDLEARLLQQPLLSPTSIRRKLAAYPTAAQTSPVLYDTIICQSTGERNKILECIHKLSAAEAHRMAPIIKEPYLTNEVRSKVKPDAGDTCLCLTFAARDFGRGSRRHSFFLLSEKSLKEYSFSWTKWRIPAPQDETEIDEITEKTQRELLEETSDFEEDEDYKKRRADLLRDYPEMAKQSRIRIFKQQESDAAAVDGSSPQHKSSHHSHIEFAKTKQKGPIILNMLSELDSHDVSSLSEVEFGAQGDLRLNFGREVTIQFADDNGREGWRDALNLILREKKLDKTHV